MTAPDVARVAKARASRVDYQWLHEKATAAGEAAAAVARVRYLPGGMRSWVRGQDGGWQAVGDPSDPEPLCGFASVLVPAASPYARWLRAACIVRGSYRVGRRMMVSIGIDGYQIRGGGCWTRLSAHADAYAACLRGNGIEGAWARNALD